MEYRIKSRIATRQGFGEALLEAGFLVPELVGLGADITASVGMNLFRDQFPDRFFSLGIAEQNCIAVAAGLALGGKLPVFSTYAVFAAHRAADQIRVSLCYNNLHVIIGGAHAGISVGPDGATHQALEDIACMRVLPNMTVISACDATQTRKATLSAIMDLKGPVYIRFGREAVPDFTPDDLPFIPGEAQLLKGGNDVCLIATGHLVWEALQAAQILETENISAAVLNIHTIKPLHETAVIQAARHTGAIVCAEEHQVTGGLGGSVAETLARNFPVPIEFVGVNDSFGESGKPEELMKKYGLTAAHIVHSAKAVIQRKESLNNQI
jgi:transketolase